MRRRTHCLRDCVKLFDQFLLLAWREHILRADVRHYFQFSPQLRPRTTLRDPFGMPLQSLSRSFNVVPAIAIFPSAVPPSTEIREILHPFETIPPIPAALSPSAKDSLRHKVGSESYACQF